ncbi:MAG: hypothetical protein MJA83_13660 [Gammaproteobacteria bacterium]|nr:hypothetical protein [Gammaproteobacteria bacterium]
MQQKLRFLSILLWGLALPALTFGDMPAEKDDGLPYPYAYIAHTCAPWDGPALTLSLAAAAAEHGSVNGPRASIAIYKSVNEISGQYFLLSGERDNDGYGAVCGEDETCRPLKSAEVFFQEIDEAAPVRGYIEFVSGDGERHSGEFTAEWLSTFYLCG